MIPESKNLLQQNCLVKPVLRIIVMRSCREAGCFNIQLLSKFVSYLSFAFISVDTYSVSI